jgi:hypothetical protein
LTIFALAQQFVALAQQQFVALAQQFVAHANFSLLCLVVFFSAKILILLFY